jgi:hypothetical protein
MPSISFPPRTPATQRTASAKYGNTISTNNENNENNENNKDNENNQSLSYYGISGSFCRLHKEEWTKQKRK